MRFNLNQTHAQIKGVTKTRNGTERHGIFRSASLFMSSSPPCSCPPPLPVHVLLLPSSLFMSSSPSLPVHVLLPPPPPFLPFLLLPYSAISLTFPLPFSPYLHLFVLLHLFFQGLDLIHHHLKTLYTLVYQVRHVCLDGNPL